MEKALELHKKKKYREADKLFIQSVNITTEMAHTYMRLLQAMKIEFYIAPYEADAQLAYLFRTNRAQVIITEDSDLLIFGVTKVLFKMDRNGDGLEI